MSDVMFCVRDPNETVSSFNKRLFKVCHDTAVTDFELHVVDGQPMVMMFAGVVEADAEDVAAAKEDGEDLKEGDIIPEDDPIIIQVAKACALQPMAIDKDGALVKGQEGDAAKTERGLDVLGERARDRVTKVRVATGTSHNWVKAPAKDGKDAKDDQARVAARHQVLGRHRIHSG